MNTPRLRTDLEASVAEEAGVRYFDVSDPRSGASMRLYEHEWLIARQMDGASSLEDVASWAGKKLGFNPSVVDLQAYARTLAELGFIDEGAAAGDETSFAGLESAPARRAVDEGPTVEMTIDEDEGRDGVERTRPTGPPVMEPEPVKVAPPAPTSQVAPTPRRPAAAPAPAPAKVPVAARAPARKTKSSVLGWVVLALLFVAGGAAYLFVAPMFAPAHVKVQPAPAPRDVLQTFPGRGTLQRGTQSTASFGEAGKIVDVVPAGTEAKPGMTLATLDGYAALEKELADVRDREVFYDGQLKLAASRKNAVAIRQAQIKVDEKKARHVEIEEKMAKTRIVATAAATVTEVMGAVGTQVAAGAPVLKLTDKRLIADIGLAPGDAKLHKVGAQVLLTPASGGSASASGRVLAVDNNKVKVELLDDGGGSIKVGDAVTLVRSRVANVIRVPLSAVSNSQGGADQVFVVTGEVIKARPVTVAGRTATDALISAGISPGDSVVVSGSNLQDGQKATTD